MNCIYCGHPKLYILSEGNYKCSLCKRKFSPKKVALDNKILDLFCKGESALTASKILNVHYNTITKRYFNYREKIVEILEEAFSEKQEVIEFNEYFYLPKKNHKDKKKIYDAINFLTFHYDDNIYNLLMPSIHSVTDKELLSESYIEEYEKFIKFHKVARLETKDGLIVDFWDYFEEEIKKFRGVNVDNFPYYLKEIEFRFNYGYNEQLTLLKDFNGDI